VGGKNYTKEVLPLDSITEYFQHFDILEIDFTFYSLLLKPDPYSHQKPKPSQNYPVLRKYKEHLSEKDGVILKIPSD
jgi:hypothetical protein